jgi:hypothetical protein
LLLLLLLRRLDDNNNEKITKNDFFPESEHKACQHCDVVEPRPRTYGGTRTKAGQRTTQEETERKKLYSNNSVEVFIGILVFAIAVMVSFIWLMVKTPISFIDAGSKMGFRKRNTRLPPTIKALLTT